jgi:hypothetical protein
VQVQTQQPQSNTLSSLAVLQVQRLVDVLVVVVLAVIAPDRVFL